MVRSCRNRPGGMRRRGEGGRSYSGRVSSRRVADAGAVASGHALRTSRAVEAARVPATFADTRAAAQTQTQTQTRDATAPGGRACRGVRACLASLHSAPRRGADTYICEISLEGALAGPAARPWRRTWPRVVRGAAPGSAHPARAVCSAGSPWGAWSLARYLGRAARLSWREFGRPAWLRDCAYAAATARLRM